MNSCGTTPLTFDRPLLSLGGEGLVEYSVNEREFECGVRGRLVTPFPLPFTSIPFSISAKIWTQCGEAVSIQQFFEVLVGC